ncbi:hypothetical protein [Halomonas organivorans]|uniref:TRAP-type C4-dicarboxylate transport system permease large subunit n=1 Tax=Halomonas organivorans TaxID=257772 RepID=A0A7W5G3U4_9GAMM|nr:hypothetical protein [Halomonas organivorans]MBB3139713.1 TRAP-type C4-dicarboxylate transport system permease large subunit [Halomonas organivorans]
MDDMSVAAFLSPLLLPVMEWIDIYPVHFASSVGTSIVIGCYGLPMASSCP